MRQYINIITARLNEEIVDMFTSPYDGRKKQYFVYKNGSKADFLKTYHEKTTSVYDDDEMGRNGIDPGCIRGLLSMSGDLYFWDGFAAAHGSLKDKYNLPDAIHLILSPTHVTVLTLWRYERNGIDRDAVEQFLKNNPHLQEIYGEDVPVKL